ncbi:nucleotidyltransferase family protein [Bosea thiooxidans]|nr:GSU2403 family nucleotidyltransferase fold protein [Bosea sp. (in: a-proteobacteria)]
MAGITYHSSLAHSAYHDLLNALRDERVSDLRGAPTRVERNGRVYWYDSYRVGTEVKKAYIGEDSPQLRERLERAAALKAAAAERRSHRTRLIRILRAEGFLPIDAATGGLVAALASAGVFRLGGTIVGTLAFRLYEGELGIRYRLDEVAQTNDIDIASFERLSLALQDMVEGGLPKLLGDFSFEPVPGLDRHRSWRWRQSRSDLLIEFLTPSFAETEEIRPLQALGIDAQSLHYLSFLLAEPIPAALGYRNGVLVQIPRPERFAIHKLIVSDRRREGADSLKSIKDRRQAMFLIDVLARDRPDELREAYQDALSRGPRWRERLGSAVARVAGLSARLDGL